jgi:ATP-dependent DNA helicase RecG
VEYAGQTLLKISVPRGLDRPYHTQRGQCFVRTNAGKRLASREEMRRMYLAVRAFYYDEVAVMDTNLDDVDVQTFDDFLSLAYGYPADEIRTVAERARLLRNLKAMRGDELTVAGLLFFGRRPQDYLPTARVDFARFAGTSAGETILDRKELTGRLPQQLEGIEEVLRLHLRNAGVIRGFEPEARYEMPLEMPREALINALVHRDYSLAAPIRVLMFDDRLEVHSPGRLPNGVTVDNIRAGIHVERNPIILSLMAKLGLMTRLGTGILRILRLAGEAGLPEPGLVESESEFVVTLYRPG